MKKIVPQRINGTKGRIDYVSLNQSLKCLNGVGHFVS